MDGHGLSVKRWNLDNQGKPLKVKEFECDCGEVLAGNTEVIEHFHEVVNT